MALQWKVAQQVLPPQARQWKVAQQGLPQRALRQKALPVLRALALPGLPQQALQVPRRKVLP
ncbi:MAG: hypothetical protein ABWY15_02195, partial [Methyloceanibacter sp.]